MCSKLISIQILIIFLHSTVADIYFDKNYEDVVSTISAAEKVEVHEHEHVHYHKHDHYNEPMAYPGYGGYPGYLTPAYSNGVFPLPGGYYPGSIVGSGSIELYIGGNVTDGISCRQSQERKKIAELRKKVPQKRMCKRRKRREERKANPLRVSNGTNEISSDISFVHPSSSKENRREISIDSSFLSSEASSSCGDDGKTADCLEVQSCWPKIVFSHRARTNLLYNEGSPEAKYVDSAEDECFLCHKKGLESNPLLSCQGSMNGVKKRKCKSMFHVKCIQNYNGGDYCYDYVRAPEGQGLILCPLHHCDACYANRRRQSAFEGNLLECISCNRAFHSVNCLPAGGIKININVVEGPEKYKGSFIVCPAHAKLPSLGRPHLTICCECEKDDGELEECHTCVRSYHPKCRLIEFLDGQPIPKNRCESCAHQETIRINRYALAKFKNLFYPCQVVEWDKYPQKKDSRFGKLGFTAVEWAGPKKEKSIIPINALVPLFDSSFDLYSKKIKLNEDEFEAWKEMIDDLEEPQWPHPYKTVRRQIVASVYYNKELKKNLPVEDVLRCDCKIGVKNRCGDQSCSNRQTDMECPAECSENPGGCHNRDVSSKTPCPDIERKKTKTRGYGVFATKNIPKGTFIAEYAGEIINAEECARRVNLIKIARDSEAQLYMMSLNAVKTVDAARAGNIARYVNHSCDPNCIIRMVKIVFNDGEGKRMGRYDDRVALYAKKDIQSGEELTFTYNMFGKELALPECRCGADNCSGSLKGRSPQDSKDSSNDSLANSPPPVGRKRSRTSSTGAPSAKYARNGGSRNSTSSQKKNKSGSQNHQQMPTDWPQQQQHRNPDHQQGSSAHFEWATISPKASSKCSSAISTDEQSQMFWRPALLPPPGPPSRQLSILPPPPVAPAAPQPERPQARRWSPTSSIASEADTSFGFNPPVDNVKPKPGTSRKRASNTTGWRPRTPSFPMPIPWPVASSTPRRSPSKSPSREPTAKRVPSRVRSKSPPVLSLAHLPAGKASRSKKAPNKPTAPASRSNARKAAVEPVSEQEKSTDSIPRPPRGKETAPSSRTKPTPRSSRGRSVGKKEAAPNLKENPLPRPPRGRSVGKKEAAPNPNEEIEEDSTPRPPRMPSKRDISSKGKSAPKLPRGRSVAKKEATPNLEEKVASVRRRSGRSVKPTTRYQVPPGEEVAPAKRRRSASSAKPTPRKQAPREEEDEDTPMKIRRSGTSAKPTPQIQAPPPPAVELTPPQSSRRGARARQVRKVFSP
ncbi:unnamed protein product [Caenorhabditis auriculariae]|uniref:Histone-lysine N-methyltransferase n=1 Tax=Caenorhabditis auriculariae TaxID=2777116 RepID=A0A8S1H2H3_9PELO|nr:unnamed protein product [Caenorhabditis auriculariae]